MALCRAGRRELLPQICGKESAYQYHCNPYATGSAVTTSVYRIEAYWRPRQESMRDCAVRLGRMLEGLAKAHPAFAQWSKKANTRRAANTPAWTMPPDIAELTQVLKNGQQYKDEPREPWPEMGYSVSAWNGRERPHGA